LGGVADWLDYMLVGWEDAGFEVTLCLTSGCGHDVGRYLARHPWPRVRVVENRTGSCEGRVRALMSAIGDTRADLVLSINLFDVYDAVRRLRHSRRRGSPRLAVALHALQADLLDDIRRNADVVDGLIATNRLACALASTAMGGPARVHYAPYGVPEPPPRSAARMVGPALRLLYAGRVEQEQKRVLDLPRVVAALRARGVDARLSIAGHGPADGMLRSAADSAGVLERIEWLGDLDRAQLAAAYAGHDALVITSVWETGPIVAWEAMSAGLPVVCSRYVGAGLEGALVDRRTAMLFEIGDIAGAADAIVRVLDPQARAAVIAGGQALVGARYTRRHSIAAWRQATTGVLAAQMSSPRALRSVPSAGRMDRWLGTSAAEHARVLLGRRFEHVNPGAAWPHSGSVSADQDAFLAHARGIDRATSDVRVHVARP
jgi:glycosyltransferase involved in cell wall biosynthesis